MLDAFRIELRQVVKGGFVRREASRLGGKLRLYGVESPESPGQIADGPNPRWKPRRDVVKHPAGRSCLVHFRILPQGST